MNAHRMRHFRSALVLLVAGITACLAQQSTSNRGKTTRQIAEPRLENHRLPYEGYGRVTIIDDASMIVQFGGEVIVLTLVGGAHQHIDIADDAAATANLAELAHDQIARLIDAQRDALA